MLIVTIFITSDVINITVFYSSKLYILILLFNMVLRRIFGPRRDEGTGEWRRLHNDELNDLYTSPNIVRVRK